MYMVRNTELGVPKTSMWQTDSFLEKYQLVRVFRLDFKNTFIIIFHTMRSVKIPVTSFQSH
jgi:hypothetical protein